MARSAREPSKAALIDNVRSSLKTAVDVLDHFERALLRGGFAEGIGAYRAMSRTLIGQRLWSQQLEGDPLRKEFSDLSARAKKVLQMLAPYAEVMRNLGAMEALGLDAAELNSDETKILEFLRVQREPVGETKLRQGVGLDGARVRRILGKLTKQALVKKYKRGNRTLYVAI